MFLNSHFAIVFQRYVVIEATLKVVKFHLQINLYAKCIEIRSY